MTGVAVRAWVVALLAVGLAGAGVTSLAAGSAVTSLTRMALAAGILSAYAALVAIVVTPRPARSLRRCLWWGGLVPVVLAGSTTVLVATRSGLAAGLMAGWPWLLGALLVCLAGTRLPSLRLPTLPRRPRD